MAQGLLAVADLAGGLLSASGAVRIGVHARGQSVGAFKLGILFYALDGLIFLAVGDWIGVGFHVFVLFFLWGGLGIAKTLAAAKQSAAVPAA